MKRKLLLTALLAGTVGMGSYAQRAMDKLDRGLVAVNTGKGIFAVGVSSGRNTTT